jgi:hypothetical protein
MSNEQRKQPNHHPKPLWWPTTIQGKIDLGLHVHEVLEPTRVDFGISDALWARLNKVNLALADLTGFRGVLKTTGEYYTELLTLILNGDFTTQYIIEKLSTAVSPAADLTVVGGLLGILIEIEHQLQQNPKYNADQAPGILLGFILPPKTKPDYEHQKFHAEYDSLPGQIRANWHKGRNTAVTFQWQDSGPEGPTGPRHFAGQFQTHPSALNIPTSEHPREVYITGRYLVHDQEVGFWSDPVRVTLLPPDHTA